MENKSNGGQIDVGVTRRWKRAGHQASTPRRVAVGWRAFGKMAPMVHTGIPTSVSSPSILSPLLVPSFFPSLSIVLCSLFSFFLFSRISTVWNSFRKDGEVGRGEEGRRRGERKERNRKEEARDRKRGEGNEVRKEVKKEKGTNPRG